jgi:hypothetical protein
MYGTQVQHMYIYSIYIQYAQVFRRQNELGCQL